MRPCPDIASRLVPGLFVALSVGLVACTEGAANVIDAGVSVAELPCSTDAECVELGLICDRLRRTCVCTSDAMCAGNPAGNYCNAFTGRCVRDVAGCKSDGDCPGGQYCDAGLRTCRSLKAWCESCSLDAECGADNFCVRHPDFPSASPFCAAACDGGCGPGQKCADTEKGRQCVPDGSRCKQVASCTPDSGKACSTDSECGDASQVCDRGQSRCVARQAGCVAGQACDPTSRQCVAACATNRECEERYSDPLYTCKSGSCVRGETCRADADCADAKWCLKPVGAAANDVGACEPVCTSSAECPLGQRCPTEVSTHRRCVAGCTTDDECPLTAVCTNGACESANQAGARRCQATQVCNPKERCLVGTGDPSRDHTCVLTEICRPGSCTPTSCGSDFCAQIFPASGAPYLRCVSRCAGDDDCPAAFYCIDLGAGGICMPNDPSICR